MPHRSLAAREFGSWLGTLAHPDRLRIVEELGQNEQDVSSLCQRLDLPQARMSQHLALLRTQRIVAVRREGRHVRYRLRHPELANWLTTGLSFILSHASESDALRDAVTRAREDWSHA
ncbi:MAG: metalloregulator ArsR/SmtB family transcription factor [bacterium]|nr:metalloregulator ArsR/SmtB family transcription factor [bacterium]